METINDLEWEKIHSEGNWGKYPNEELVRFVGRNYFHLNKKERSKIKILEIGCGQGANLWFLAKEGFDTYGIDISPSAIKKTKDFLEKEWKINNVNLYVMNMKKLDFEHNSFDLVFDIFSIACMTYADIADIYRGLYKLLKKGGKFWIFTPAEGYWGQNKGIKTDYKTIENITEGPLKGRGRVCFLGRNDILNLLKNTGFRSVQIEKMFRTYNNEKEIINYWIVECEK